MTDLRRTASARLLVLTLLVAAACVPLAGTQPALAREPAPIEEVKSAYALCQQLQRKSEARRVDLFDVSDGKSGASKWVREQPAEDALVYDALALFLVGDAVRVAVRETATPSGDWMQSTEHCFRPDGSIAFVFVVLRTFHGNVKVEDRFYFDANGERIRSLRSVEDMKTHKPIAPEEASFMERPPDLYRSARELVEDVGGSKLLDSAPIPPR